MIYLASLWALSILVRPLNIVIERNSSLVRSRCLYRFLIMNMLKFFQILLLQEISYFSCYFFFTNVSKFCTLALNITLLTDCN